MKRAWVLTIAVALTGSMTGMMLGGCTGDESAPNRRGIERPSLLQGGEQGKENAEKRATEPTPRDMPAAPSELPGQSRHEVLPAGMEPVVTLASMGDPAAPETRLPPLRDDAAYITPGRTAIPVPDTDWVIENYVGEPEAFTVYPHRPFMRREATYYRGDVPHNPVYMAPAVWQPSVVDRCPGSSGRGLKDALDIPVFVGQFFILPVLMVIQPPLALQTTRWAAESGLYQAAPLEGGKIMPAPVPGRITWVYPFMEARQSRMRNEHHEKLPILPGTDVNDER